MFTPMPSFNFIITIPLKLSYQHAHMGLVREIIWVPACPRVVPTGGRACHVSPMKIWPRCPCEPHTMTSPSCPHISHVGSMLVCWQGYYSTALGEGGRCSACYGLRFIEITYDLEDGGRLSGRTFLQPTRHGCKAHKVSDTLKILRPRELLT